MSKTVSIRQSCMATLGVLLLLALGCSRGEQAKGPAQESSVPPGEQGQVPPSQAVPAKPPGPSEGVRSAPGKPAATRTYPSFPDALTEAPEWLSAQAPFDVAAFLKVPPEAENATPLYLDALFEFGPEVAPLFAPEEQERRRPIAQQRAQASPGLYEAWVKDPASVDQAALGAWVAQFEPGFPKLAAAQQRPRCGFQTGFSYLSLLPHVQGSRTVARLIVCRNWLDLQKGDFERPIQGVESVLRLSRDLRPRAGLVCQLVSIALDGMCYQQMAPAILGARGINAEHCDRLLAALARHEREAIDPFLEGLRVEYLMIRMFFHDLEHHTGMFNPGVARGRQLLYFVAAIDGEGPDPEKLDPQKREAAAKKAEEVISQIDWAKQRDVLDRFYPAAAALSGATAGQRQKAANDVEQIGQQARRDKHFIAFLLPAMSAMSESVTRDKSLHRGTKCLVALRRWQLEHDTMPSDLQSVVKAAGMAEVPIDPYSDEPLKMAVVNGQPVVYSVGADGQDDKALVEWDFKFPPKGDLLFRLPALPGGTPAAKPVARTWTDRSGKFSIVAELVELKDGTARLKKDDGSVVTVPAEKLSDADQAYLKEHSKKPD